MTERELAEILRNNPDIRVINGDAQPQTPLPAILRTAGMSALSAKFLQLWSFLGGPPLVQEYKFHTRRRWRFDFALPDRKIAVEINGGVWVHGRHTRARGYLADREKINAATADGWRVFELGTGQVTPEHVQTIVDLCH